MKQLLAILVLIPLSILVLSCEEDTDYAADIIGNYIVESISDFDGTLDLSDYPEEEALFVKITRDEITTYYNDFPCETSYSTESDGLDEVTETAIVFSDASESEYSIVDGKLRVSDSGDIIILASYDGPMPPAVFSDPSLLTNDTYEPNNSMTEATAIAAGGTVQNHYLGVCEDQDFFIFTAVAGTSYHLGTTTPSNSYLDLTMILASGAGVELADNDDYDWPNVNPGLDWTCEISGDYYFLIEGFYDDEGGNYSAFVTEITGLPKRAPATIEQQKETSSRHSYWGNLFN